MTSKLIDSFGRHITYLRLSVTDRCDLRCSYCMSPQQKFLPKAQILSLEELNNIAEVFADMGINKIRITGGEPLVRRNVEWLIERASALMQKNDGELTLTTNATQLKKFASILRKNQVKRINVSLDTLDKDQYLELTRGGKIQNTLDGIDAALDQGIKIKINTVVLNKINIDKIDDLISFTEKKGMDITFIEIMPMGDIPGTDRIESFYPLIKLKSDLKTKLGLIASTYKSGGPANYYVRENSKQKIGFITPLSDNFCSGCNRVRVTSSGMLYPCLGHMGSVLLRKNNPPNADSPKEIMTKQEIQELILKSVAKKPKCHSFAIEEGVVSGSTTRNMNVTGG